MLRSHLARWNRLAHRHHSAHPLRWQSETPRQYVRVRACLFCALSNNLKVENPSLSVCFPSNHFVCFRCNNSGNLAKYEEALVSHTSLPTVVRQSYEEVKRRYARLNSTLSQSFQINMSQHRRLTTGLMPPARVQQSFNDDGLSDEDRRFFESIRQQKVLGRSPSSDGLEVHNSQDNDLKGMTVQQNVHEASDSGLSPLPDKFAAVANMPNIAGSRVTNPDTMVNGRDLVIELERPFKNLMEVWKDDKTSNHPAMAFLESRGLKRDVCMLYKVGFRTINVMSKNGEPEPALVVTFPYYHRYGEFDPKSLPVKDRGDHVIRRYKMRGVHSKNIMRSYPAGQNAQTFFGWHTIPANAREVVITEGEIDAMTVFQETGVPAVSVPNGASSFADTLVQELSRFDKIILWFDDDLAGREGCEKAIAKLTARFGFSKCLVVRPSEAERAACRGPSTKPEDAMSKPKDANDFLLQGYDISKLLSTKRSLRHDRIVTASETMRELVELFRDPERRKGKQFSEFPSINTLLGGHRPGELTLISGPTGSGKTTLLSQLSLDLCLNGVPTLWGSFEIDVIRLEHIMISQFVYKSVYGSWSPNAAQLRPEVQYPDLTQENMLVRYASSFSTLPMYFMNFFGSTSIDDVMAVMASAVEGQDVQHIVIDNLQYMVSGSGAEKDWRPKQNMYSNFNKFEAMERALDYFRAFATNRKVHVSVVIHPRKVAENIPLTLDSIMGSAKATQEADNVICIQRLEDGRKCLDLKKNRFNGTLGRMELSFDPASKCFFDGGFTGSRSSTIGSQSNSSFQLSANTFSGPVRNFSPGEDAALMEGATEARDGSEIDVFEKIREDILPHRHVHELQARFQQLRRLSHIG